MSANPLDPVRSVKVKLGLLVAASVTAASLVATVGSAGGVPIWLSIPVTIALALAITQLLAVGMTSPLRQMTAAADQMAKGDYSARIETTSRDEIGELARAFNQMATDLDQVDRQRRELIANVSHELRTPLTALCAVLENLADGVNEPDPQILRTALAQGERLTALVNDLLDLSRVDAGAAPLLAEQVRVVDLLSAAAAEFSYGDLDVEVSVSVEPEGLLFQADPARLSQLVANLVDNATRHSPAGGRVQLLAVGGVDNWTLEVVDEGPGVAPTDRELAFERFGTLRDAEGGGGTGLGLAIARWVSDLHGGTIAFVDPLPGAGGARVEVTLPLSPAKARTGQDPATELTTAGETRPIPKEDVVTDQKIGPNSANENLPPVPTGVERPKVVSFADSVFGSLWPDHGVPGRPRLLVWAILVGLFAGFTPALYDLGLGTFIILMAAGLMMFFVSARRSDPYVLGSALLCTALAATALVRDADWIVVLCLLAGGVVTAVAIADARRVPAFLFALMAWPLAGLRGLPWLGRTLQISTRAGQGLAVARTVIWSLLGLIVFGMLFISADAIFADWFGALVPDLGSLEFVGRVFIAVAIAALTLTGAYFALNPPKVGTVGLSRQEPARRFEWLVPVLVVNVVFVAFLVAQAAAIFGGREYFERTTGLTYAEYVHQGFGQLTVVTALTLLVVWAASRKASRETVADRAWLRGSLGALCLMTLAVLGSAFNRMGLYQDAYGFTSLRLLVDVFMGWLGLLLVATLVAGVVLRAGWLPRFGLLSGAVLLLGLAAINPDAWVANHNLDRYEETGKVDWTYLAMLSDDAVPTLVSRLDGETECVLTTQRREPATLLEWNLGRIRAEETGQATLAYEVYDRDCQSKQAN